MPYKKEKLLDCFLAFPFLPLFLFFLFLGGYVCKWVDFFTHGKWSSYKVFKIYNENVVSFWNNIVDIRLRNRGTKRVLIVGKYGVYLQQHEVKWPVVFARFRKQSLSLPPCNLVFVLLLKLSMKNQHNKINKNFHFILS